MSERAGGRVLACLHCQDRGRLEGTGWRGWRGAHCLLHGDMKLPSNPRRDNPCRVTGVMEKSKGRVDEPRGGSSARGGPRTRPDCCLAAASEGSSDVVEKNGVFPDVRMVELSRHCRCRPRASSLASKQAGLRNRAVPPFFPLEVSKPAGWGPNGARGPGRGLGPGRRFLD